VCVCVYGCVGVWVCALSCGVGWPVGLPLAKVCVCVCVCVCVTLYTVLFPAEQHGLLVSVAVSNRKADK
jgi:hypothetical protein